MLPPHANCRVATELARRLEFALHCIARVVVRTSSGWSPLDSGNLAIEQNLLLAEVLERLHLTSEQPFVLRKQGRLLVAVNVSPSSKTPVVVVVDLPDENEPLVVSLVTAYLEAAQLREEVAQSQSQSECFIDQVTQDFEELTWLRNTHEYFDLCGTRHTIDSIARNCLPELANVICAETILFVPSYEERRTRNWIPDWDNVFVTGCLSCDISVTQRFLQNSIEAIVKEPRVANCKGTETHLADYPGIRHCIALSVSKGARVYGWILAINKLPNHSNEFRNDTSDLPEIARSFGTFEAGLLIAVSNIMSSHSRNLELLKDQESLLTGVVRASINAIDAKDPYTCGHSDRVAMLAKRIAAKLGKSQEKCEQIYMAGLLHDIGKIGIPDWILGKPGKLTDEEFAIVKKHPVTGYEILKHLKQLDYVLPGVLHHHEAVNGTGYPSGLVGDAIPMQGRILAVADAYDAMTSDRPYRKGMPSEKAESILREESGRIWDAKVVAAFLECLASDASARDEANENLAMTSSFVMADTTELMNRIAISINSMVAE